MSSLALEWFLIHGCGHAHAYDIDMPWWLDKSCVLCIKRGDGEKLCDGLGQHHIMFQVDTQVRDWESLL